MSAPKQTVKKVTGCTNSAIAIVGISGQFPGAPDLEVFWQNLMEGRNVITEIPTERWDWRNYTSDIQNETATRWGGFVDGIESFDADFFHISSHEAALMDPQHRKCLETVWNCLENAGIRPCDISGSRTGVFVGVTNHDYAERLGMSDTDVLEYTSTGNAFSMLANRISSFFDLLGPSEPVDTACSSSLVAVDHALQAIYNGYCDAAIVGGVNALLMPTCHTSFSRAGVLSPDGCCKAFDEDANGYVRAEGFGAMYLKPLAEAERNGDHIHAIIRGSRVNHSGNSASLAVPNSRAQIQLLLDTYKKADVDPRAIGYIEAHGASSASDDSVEITALKEAFSTLYQQKNLDASEVAHCGIGSVKSNIGHAEAASGMAGLLKVILALQHKTLPATLHLHNQNAGIDLEGTPFRFITQTTDWETYADMPRCAGVSSFGAGGVNAHVIVEEFTANENITSEKSARLNHQSYCIVLSAQTEGQLKARVSELIDYLPKLKEEDLLRLAFTLQLGRVPMTHRVAFVVSDLKKLAEQMAAFSLEADNTLNNFFRGICNNATALLETEEINLLTQRWIANGRLDRLAAAWVNGEDIDWSTFYESNPGRLPLPGYPFAAQHFPLPDLFLPGASLKQTGGAGISNAKQPLPADKVTMEECHVSSGAYQYDEHIPSRIGVQQQKVEEITRAGADIEQVSRILAVAEKQTSKEDEIVEILCRYLSEIGEVPLKNLDPDATITDLGLNSMVITELTARLEPLLGFRDPVIFYSARSIRDAAVRIDARSPGLSLSKERRSAAKASVWLHSETHKATARSSVSDVAIIGLSGRYPQAENVLQFAELLAEGRDCIEAVPDTHRAAGDELRWGGFLSQPMNFDYGQFNMSFRDALMTHPEERLLLQETWRCFESAGYNPVQWVGGKGSNVGVYIGASFHEYSELVAESNRCKGDMLPYSSQIFSYANRLSYFFNLTGPSIAIDCACSSSLYAIADAYNAIRFGLCEMALAGGVNLNLHRSKYEFLSDKNALSKDGRCRAFAEGGTGYVPSEGVGMVLLKSLECAEEDGDNVLAVIKGVAAGNDGRTQGFTVPNPDAQRDTIRKAFDAAGVSPQSISFVECHGTGTSLGDPIEMSALSEAFGKNVPPEGCPISSLKSNIGHLEAAAGIAQITKVILQLKSQQYFPNVMHHENLNPNIDFSRIPFKVQKELAPWPVSESQPVRRAGISSFGAGGTNVHLILEQAPESFQVTEPDYESGFKYIIPFSAATPEQLVDMVRVTYQYIRSEQALLNTALNVRNIAATLQCGRSAGRYRFALICDDSMDVLLTRLKVYLEGCIDSTMISGEEQETGHSELMGMGVSITELLAVAKNWVVGKVKGFQHDPKAKRAYLPGYIFRPDLVSPVTEGKNSMVDVSVTDTAPDQAIAAPDISALDIASTDTLTRVRDTLKRVLGALPEVYTDKTLFGDLGIDSIMGTKIHTELCRFYPTLDMFALFEFNTSTLLSSHLDTLATINGQAAPESSVDDNPPTPEKEDVGDIGALEFGETLAPIKRYVDAYHNSSGVTHKIMTENVSVNGVRIECLVCGEGPTVILLPPFNSSAVIWIRQLQGLSGKYRIIVPHYPGLSGSDWVDGLDNFEQLAGILTGVIDELVTRQIIQNKKNHWVGWSLGGFVAQTICKHYPQYVDKLVLISTTTISWSSEEYTISAEDFSIKCAEEFEENFQKLPGFLRKMPEIKAFRKEGHIERFVWCTTNRRILDSYFMMIARFRHVESAEHVRARTLLISGGDDVLMPPKFARELSEKIPDAEYHEIKNGHHFLSLFHYKKINKLLSQWFSD
ncbi:MAG TPA: alpha/beta fold hydrolase [Gammaproteobacteria bacterium]|nr:alpha/beta fold hydrolase [Gammaproteobacteria bacterium]